MEDIYVFDMGKVIKHSFDKPMFYSMIEAKIGFDDFDEYFEAFNLITEIGEISSDQFLQKILNYSLSTKSLDEAKLIYNDCSGSLYKDTMDILHTLKDDGKKIYLLSNMKEIDFQCFKKKLDINMFDDLFLSFELKYRKSNLKIFQIMINKLKVNPQNIYFFDDLPINIKNAKSLGINSYLVTGDTILETWNKIYKTQDIGR